MEKIVILTGAGISAESGLSTFRDEGGLWAQHRVEDVATPEGFARSVQISFFTGVTLRVMHRQIDWVACSGPAA